MELVVSSFIAFASTNIDDLFVLMLFFGNSRFKAREVIIGQYLGILLLIVISFIGSFVGLFIDKSYIGLLGLLPVFLGFKTLIKYFKLKQSESSDKIHSAIETKSNSNIFSVAAVTFANGGDNISIYIPLFATLALGDKLIMISIFLVMVGFWCWIGKYLSKHPMVAKTMDKYGHWVTPIVLILLGCYILYESGTLNLIHLYSS